MTCVPKLWVVVTCMGRLAALRMTLPSVLENFDCTYCLVDYSCPMRCGSWAEREHQAECRQGRLVIARVNQESVFHKARALNAGARRAVQGGAEQIAFMDADTFARKGSGTLVLEHLHTNRFLVLLGAKSLVGFLVVPAGRLLRVGAFDETIVGYGGEDIEMRLRLYLMGGLEYVALPPGAFGAVAHSDKIRSEYYEVKDRSATNDRNLAYVRRRVRAWTGRTITELGPNVRRLYGVRAGEKLPRPPSLAMPIRRRDPSSL